MSVHESLPQAQKVVLLSSGVGLAMHMVLRDAASLQMPKPSATGAPFQSQCSCRSHCAPIDVRMLRRQRVAESSVRPLVISFVLPKLSPA